MKKSERSTYTPIDFLEWHQSGSLIITPKFQRRSVWSRPAKSYLIDTLLLNLPVPPIYLRVMQSKDKTKVIREVIDGQQRITAILEFIEGKYSLANNIEANCKGKYFVDLNNEQKEAITQYSFICEVFHGVGDSDILKVFSRMNLNSVKLNAQELRNGMYFGPFKRCCFDLAYEHLEFWRVNKIFTERAIARMKEAELTSELIIAMIDGQQDKKKSIETFYKKNDKSFAEQKKVTIRFKKIIDIISDILGDDLEDLEFRRPPIFYSMFLALYHKLYGLPNCKLKRSNKSFLTAKEKMKFKESLIDLSHSIESYRSDEFEPANKQIQRFIDACITSTDTIMRRNTRLNTIYKMAFM